MKHCTRKCEYPSRSITVQFFSLVARRAQTDRDLCRHSVNPRLAKVKAALGNGNDDALLVEVWVLNLIKLLTNMPINAIVLIRSYLCDQGELKQLRRDRMWIINNAPTNKNCRLQLSSRFIRLNKD